ncbi:hypothetical protein BGZ98_001048 [Dissophora globulifera]|nr:hypothetical protein BGZ98_001048 [Dissophora globulifera]
MQTTQIIPVVAGVCGVFFLSTLLIFLIRVYKRLQIRYAKPPPNALPRGLEQHQELAFVFAHGVEAYNERRRQRQQQQRAQTLSANATAASDDTASIGSQPSSSSIAEPLPAYSPDPVNGDVGYGWRIASENGRLGAPAVTGGTTTPDNPLMLTWSTAYPLYIYQPPSARSTVQAALLSTDNSPSVSVTTVPAAAAAAGNSRSVRTSTRAVDRRGSNAMSVVSGILARGRGNAPRPTSWSSSLSASSSGTVPSESGSTPAVPPLPSTQSSSSVIVGHETAVADAAPSSAPTANSTIVHIDSERTDD